MTTLTESINTIEKKLEICTSKINSTSPININVEKNIEKIKYVQNVNDLKSYITTYFLKISEKDAEIIAIETNKQCITQNIPFTLVVGIIEVESSYNKFARSKKGALGLMQVKHDVWADELGIRVKDLYHVNTNIMAGIEVLKYYLDQNKGNLLKSLKDYNGSYGNRFGNQVHKAMKNFSLFRNNKSKTIEERSKLNDSKTKNR